MQGTLASKNRQVRINISDESVLLFNDDENKTSDLENAKDENPLFTKQNSIEMYGRIWDFDIQSSVSFRHASSNTQPYWVLIGGLIIDTLLLGLFLFLSRANRTALIFADKITEALEDESRRLTKSNHDLEQFSYIASHDLKAPLNSIKQVLGWIEEDCKDLLPEESKKHIEMLKNRSQRMMKLLKDLLDYSQVNRFDYAEEKIELNKMASDILFLYGTDKDFKCIAPKIDLNIAPAPLEIVLRNLISNTIKHHHLDSGTIVVSYQREEKGHLFRVEDDGPGIPDDLHAKAL